MRIVHSEPVILAAEMPAETARLPVCSQCRRSLNPARRGAHPLSVEMQYWGGRWHDCKVVGAPCHVVQRADQWKVRRVRIELTTLGLWDLRAANCAIAAHAELIIHMIDAVGTILNTHHSTSPPYPVAVTLCRLFVQLLLQLLSNSC